MLVKTFEFPLTSDKLVLNRKKWAKLIDLFVSSTFMESRGFKNPLYIQTDSDKWNNVSSNDDNQDVVNNRTETQTTPAVEEQETNNGNEQVVFGFSRDMSNPYLIGENEDGTYELLFGESAVPVVSEGNTTSESSDAEEGYVMTSFDSNSLSTQIISKWLQAICDKYKVNESEIILDVATPFKNNKMFVNYTFTIPSLTTADTLSPTEFINYQDYDSVFKVICVVSTEIYSPVTAYVINTSDITTVEEFNEAKANGTCKTITVQTNTSVEIKVKYGGSILFEADNCDSYLITNIASPLKMKIMLYAKKDLGNKYNIIHIDSEWKFNLLPRFDREPLLGAPILGAVSPAQNEIDIIEDDPNGDGHHTGGGGGGGSTRPQTRIPINDEPEIITPRTSTPVTTTHEPIQTIEPVTEIEDVTSETGVTLVEEPDFLKISIESLNTLGLRLLNMGRLGFTLDYSTQHPEYYNMITGNYLTSKDKLRPKRNRRKKSKSVWHKIELYPVKKINAIDEEFGVYTTAGVDPNLPIPKKIFTHKNRYMKDAPTAMEKKMHRRFIMSYDIRAMLRDVHYKNNSTSEGYTARSVSPIDCIYDTYTVSKKYTIPQSSIVDPSINYTYNYGAPAICIVVYVTTENINSEVLPYELGEAYLYGNSAKDKENGHTYETFVCPANCNMKVPINIVFPVVTNTKRIDGNPTAVAALNCLSDEPNISYNYYYRNAFSLQNTRKFIRGLTYENGESVPKSVTVRKDNRVIGTYNIATHHRKVLLRDAYDEEIGLDKTSYRLYIDYPSRWKKRLSDTTEYITKLSYIGSTNDLLGDFAIYKSTAAGNNASKFKFLSKFYSLGDGINNKIDIKQSTRSYKTGAALKSIERGVLEMNNINLASLSSNTNTAFIILECKIRKQAQATT